MTLESILTQIAAAAGKRHFGLVLPEQTLSIIQSLKHRGFSVSRLDDGRTYVRWGPESFDMGLCTDGYFKAPDAYLLARTKGEPEWEKL